jgi:hypothetical protein
LCPEFPVPEYKIKGDKIIMKKLFFAFCLSLFLMTSIAGCGSGSGGSGAAATTTGSGDSSTTGGGSGSTTANATVGVVKLAWDAPANSDGTPVSNIAGFNVHYGTSSRNYDKTVNNGMLTTFSISGLAPGTYYFSVTSYDSSGKESAFSNEVSKTVQ